MTKSARIRWAARAYLTIISLSGMRESRSFVAAFDLEDRFRWSRFFWMS